MGSLYLSAQTNNHKILNLNLLFNSKENKFCMTNDNVSNLNLYGCNLALTHHEFLWYVNTKLNTQNIFYYTSLGKNAPPAIFKG